MLQHVAITAVLAQAIPPQTSVLGWMLGSLNSMTGLLVLASSVTLFAGACYLLRTKQKPVLIASYLVLLPLPMFISVFGWIKGSISSLVVIASAPDLQLTNADIAGGLAAGLLSVLIALLVSAPTYFVLAYALLSRTWERPNSASGAVRVAPAKSPQPQAHGLPLAPA